MRTIVRTAPLPTLLAAALLVPAAALLVPAAAGAQGYPKPERPGKVASKPKGPHTTRTVCHHRGRCDFRSIQKAVKHSRAGDTIRIKHGTYHEGVFVRGRRKRWLRIVGDPKHPGKVVLDGRHLKGARANNAFFIDGADHVTLRGIKAHRYKGNGFFVTNAVGYAFRNLIAARTGVYGLYAFNTKGGLMAHSEAYYANDAPFYIGQTPPQAKPIRTTVRDVEGWGSPIGFSGTNMRYVTITKSRFYDNAVGIVPNALDSEAYPPAEDNVIVDNDIFWNNFNFHAGAPFPQPKPSSTGSLVPIGTGILLLGGRGNRVEGNRIHGNFLAGVALIDGILLADEDNQDAISLDRNTVSGNELSSGGADANGFDLVYDGSGSDNCFASNTGILRTFPAAAARFPACPFSGANGLSDDDRATMLSWIGEGALKAWSPHAHPAMPGYTPLETYAGKDKGGGHASAARAHRRKTVHIGDNYFAPHRLKVRRGTRITWKWPSFENAGQVHDVQLTRRPHGVKRFHSAPAASDYAFRRKLRKPGLYRFVCTYHEDMKLTIRVRRRH